MSQLIDNLNIIESVKTDIKSAIEAKGVDMTGISFPGYASKIGEISGGGGVNPSGTLEVSENGVYNVYSYASVSVDVPISGWDQKSLTEGANEITNLNNTASFVASYAFAYNKNIQTVNLPYATTISNNAFDYCRSLTKVSLPMCSYIGSSAFQNCSLLTQVSLPVCSHIDTFAFRDCELLSQVSLPVCSLIDSYAFFWCSSLSQISLPVCSDIGMYAFCRCSLLSQVNLPMCSIIGGYAFYNCSSLSQVNLPVCSYIGDSAFYDTNLTSLTLGSNSVVTLVGDNQFFPTDMLSIYVPGSLYSQYITDPKWISYSSYIFLMSSIDSTPALSFENGLLYGSISAISSTDWTALGISTTDIISVSLPDCLSVADKTFIDCSSLQTISLPMCEYIGSSAFDYCSAISGTLYFPNCTYLGQRAFGHRSFVAPGRVDRVILPAVSSMSDYTLYLNGCSYIYFGASTITFNRNVYYNYSDGNCSVYIAAQNISWSYTGTAQKSFTTMSNIVDVYVRSELVQTLQNNAYWSKCRSISSFDPDNFDPWNPTGE